MDLALLWIGISFIVGLLLILWHLLRNEGAEIDDHEGRDSGAPEGRWK